MEEKPKRKKLWINPLFQKRFLLNMVMVQLLAAFLGVLFFNLGTLGLLLLVEGESDSNIVIQTIVTFSILIILILMTSFWIAIRFSHRICGPVYRTLKTLEAIHSGDMPKEVTFREGDDFWELAEALNKVLEKLYENKS